VTTGDCAPEIIASGVVVFTSGSFPSRRIGAALKFDFALKDGLGDGVLGAEEEDEPG
jgi:hypothetical protein